MDLTFVENWRIPNMQWKLKSLPRFVLFWGTDIASMDPSKSNPANSLKWNLGLLNSRQKGLAPVQVGARLLPSMQHRSVVAVDNAAALVALHDGTVLTGAIDENTQRGLKEKLATFLADCRQKKLGCGFARVFFSYSPIGESLEETLSVFLMFFVGSLWLAKNLRIPQARNIFLGLASFDAASFPFSPVVHIPIPSNSALIHQHQVRQDHELLQHACLNEWKVILQGFHFCNSSQPLSRTDDGMETDLSFRDLQPLAPQGSFYEAWQINRIFSFRGCKEFQESTHGFPGWILKLVGSFHWLISCDYAACLLHACRTIRMQLFDETIKTDLDFGLLGRFNKVIIDNRI